MFRLWRCLFRILLLDNDILIAHTGYICIFVPHNAMRLMRNAYSSICMMTGLGWVNNDDEDGDFFQGHFFPHQRKKGTKQPTPGRNKKEPNISQSNQTFGPFHQASLREVQGNVSGGWLLTNCQSHCFYSEAGWQMLWYRSTGGARKVRVFY